MRRNLGFVLIFCAFLVSAYPVLAQKTAVKTPETFTFL
ncbi:MAG: hypothetical protein JWL77_3490, partial [Chthonomonadaceae bacterium]|nr:hypothetical protein [Chthonomonadaceae bacterium]